MGWTEGVVDLSMIGESHNLSIHFYKIYHYGSYNSAH